MGWLEREIQELLRNENSLKHKRKVVMWMQKNGILRRCMNCKSCNKKMSFVQITRQDGFHWVCRQHRQAVSIRKGSLFYKSHKSLRNHLEFIYRFSKGLRLRQIDLTEDGIAGSSRTLSKMASSLRQVCRRAVCKLRVQGKMRVGGRHCFVMLDESKFSHKRKYNRGRMGPAWRRNKKWVFGILEVAENTRRPILKVVSRHSKEELLPIIRRHIKRGSSIVTDEWRAYSRALSEEGYDHHTVCHKRHFVDPDTRAHTQNLERAWQTYKCEVWRHRGNRTTKLLKEHLRLIGWEYWLGRSHRNGILGRLLHDIRKFNEHECC